MLPFGCPKPPPKWSILSKNPDKVLLQNEHGRDFEVPAYGIYFHPRRYPDIQAVDAEPDRDAIIAALRAEILDASGHREGYIYTYLTL